MCTFADQDTCESLSGFQVVLEATWAHLKTKTLVNALAVFKSFWKQQGLFLKTKTLVQALAVFKAFWAQHGPLEDRDTCERLSGFQIILGATWPP